MNSINKCWEKRKENNSLPVFQNEEKNKKAINDKRANWK